MCIIIVCFICYLSLDVSKYCIFIVLGIFTSILLNVFFYMCETYTHLSHIRWLSKRVNSLRRTLKENSICFICLYFFCSLFVFAELCKIRYRIDETGSENRKEYYIKWNNRENTESFVWCQEWTFSIIFIGFGQFGNTHKMYSCTVCCNRWKSAKYIYWVYSRTKYLWK